MDEKDMEIYKLDDPTKKRFIKLGDFTNKLIQENKQLKEKAKKWDEIIKLTFEDKNWSLDDAVEESIKQYQLTNSTEGKT